MNVTLPNGRVIEGVPEGTTKQQIMQKAISAGLATEADFGISPAQKDPSGEQAESPGIAESYIAGGGPLNPASLLGAAYNAYRAQSQKSDQSLAELEKTNPYQAEIIRDMNPLERVAVGFQAGLRQVARGVGLGDPNDPNAQYEKALTDASVAGSIGEIAGNAAPFVPAGLAAGGARSVASRVGLNSLIGGAEGGIIARGTGQDSGGIISGSMAGAAIGGGAEILSSGLSRIAGPLVRKYFGEGARALDDAGNPTPELNEAMAREGVNFDDLIRASEAPEQSADALTPERAARNQQRADAFQRLGVEPTEAQRTRDKSLFSIQQERYKTGGKVTEALERQEQQLSNAAANAVAQTGGDALNAVQSPIEIVTNRSLRADQEISELYKQARESAPTAKNVRFNNAARVLRQFAPDNELSGGVIASLRGTLEQSGALNGFTPSGRVSVESAEKIRQKANQIFASTNDQGKAIIRQFKDALDEDVGQAVGEDWFKKARSAKASFEAGLDREKFNKFDDRNVNIVRDMLNNKITPDDIQKGALVNAGSKYKAQDLVDLKRYLTAGAPEDIEQGTKAWNDIRASAMQQIKDVAFSGPVTESGSQQLSRAGLEKALKQIGRQKFNVLFTPREQRFLFNLAEVSRYKEPPSGTFSGLGPSGQAIQQLENKITSIYGVQIPILSSIKGKLSERQVLKINDDLSQIEKERLLEMMKPYRSAISSGAASTATAGNAQEDSK